MGAHRPGRRAGRRRGRVIAPPARIARCVVEVEPFHLDHTFDYRVGDDLDDPVHPGSRVEVVFAGRRRRALVTDVTDRTDVEPARLRDVRRTLGPHPWVRPDDLELLAWAGRRWGAPVADVVRHALPGRTVAVERAAASAGWFPPVQLTRASHPGDEPSPRWLRYGAQGRELAVAAHAAHGAYVWRPLPDEDVGACLADLVAATVAGGRDAVVVAPDGASRVARRLVELATSILGRDRIADVRGSAAARTTYRAWLRSRCGQVRLLVGERGVAFWPLERLGLAVVLDEANPALKEQRSPRHHVREVLLERARRAAGVGVLVTTVPSAATWALLRQRRVTPVVAPRGLERDLAPRVQLDDASAGPRTRLGTGALPALRRAVAAGRYGIVLAARTGEGTALVCAACRHRLRCPACQSSLGAAGRDQQCRTCGWQGSAPACPECGNREVVALAAGAQRVGTELRRTIRDVPVVALEGHDQPLPPPPAVVVMTRGSVMDDAPGSVGAVVLPDLEALARRPAVEAPEDTLRLAMAVAAWATDDAIVVVRAQDPGDPVVQALVRWDPGGFWRAEAPRRAELGFPPARQAVTIHVGGDPQDLRQVVAAHAPRATVLGPVPADHGLHRILCLTDDRAALLDAIAPWRRTASRAGRVVRVDVDPVGMS